jgi:hypothetical protein
MTTKMWEGVISFKSIETGDKISNDKTCIASSRVALQNLYMFYFDKMDKNTTYMVVEIDSPIGRFHDDVMGWERIHLMRKYHGGVGTMH